MKRRRSINGDALYVVGNFDTSDFKNISSIPTAPHDGKITVYAQNNKLHVLNSVGTVIEVGSGGGGGTVGPQGPQGPPRPPRPNRRNW